MTITINPKYQHLLEWLHRIPTDFDFVGNVIYSGRNIVKSIVAPDGQRLCVKRYHVPLLFNRIAYTFLRSPKALRAYSNGLEIIHRGFETPTPIAYILNFKNGLLSDSYLITEMSEYSGIMRNFSLNYTPDLENIIRPFARFTAALHNSGILHLDYSPGNILYEKKLDGWHFSIIDINRLKFQSIDMVTGCKNIQRLAADTHFFEVFAEEYAKARHFDTMQCLSLILKYRNRFWHNGKKAYYKYL